MPIFSEHPWTAGELVDRAEEASRRAQENGDRATEHNAAVIATALNSMRPDFVLDPETVAAVEELEDKVSKIITAF